MALRYYLKIDGIAGGSAFEGQEGAFDVFGYSFDVTSIVTAMRGSGGGSGRTDFSPLTVNLDASSGLTSLLSNLARGEHIPSLQLLGVSDDGETVYDLRLGDVTVTRFIDGGTGNDTLSFDYRQVSVTTTEQNADGSVDEPQTVSFDLATNAQGVDIPEPDVPSDGAAGGQAQRYFLTIDGIAGDSTSKGHEGAFDLEGYNFDISAIATAMRGAGGGAGHTVFSPLSVVLDLNSGLTSLLSHLASGEHIQSLQLQGVSADGETVYDLRLGDVIVTRLQDSTGNDVVSFSYSQVSITTTGQNADGSLAEPETFSWDIAGNHENVDISEPQVPTGGPTGGDAQSYYLTIDGIAGGSTSDGHEGAFDVGNYSFDVSAIASAMRGTGGGAGHTDFAPLTVALDVNSGLTSLLNYVASGRHIPSLQLQGVSADGQTVYDLRLGDVTVTSFFDTSSGQDMLSFSYRQVSVTTTGQSADGSIEKPVTFSWDIATNQEGGVDIPEPRVPTDAAPVGEPQNYFLTIDGIAGGSNAKGHEGAFDIDGYSFDVSAIVAATRGAGGGAGRSEFSPLTVSLDANTGLTSLLSNLTSGRHIDSLQLQGVSADGQTVYDLRLGDVIVTQFQDSNGQDMLSFEYRQVSVTTTGQNADGSLAEPETFSWDLAANRSGVDIPEPTVPTGGSDGAQAHSYYLTIDGIAGSSNVEGHEGAFDVDGYSFDISAIVSAMRGGGSGAGHTEFSPLTVNIDANAALTSLLSNLASGRHIESLQLQGVSADGHTVYDLRLGDVTVTSYHDSNGQEMLSFDYRQVSLTTTGQNADGSLDEPETFSWDRSTGSAAPTIPEPDVPANGASVGTPQSYFLTIDGVAGGSIVEDHVGAFDVEGYSFDVAAIVSAVRAGGGGAGRTDFSPLTVNLDANSDMTSLLSHAANGSHIASLQLQGVSADGETVYDLRLGDVTVTTFHDSNTGRDVLSFDYRQVSITTTGQTADGRIAAPETFSWDVATNQQGGVDIPEPRVPADGDVLVGSPGGVLTGTHPGHDQFVFTGNFGHNEITNFSPSDHIVLERSHFGNASEILEHHASDDGHGNTVITDPQNPDNVIVLDHVSVEELDVTDFVLL